MDNTLDEALENARCIYRREDLEREIARMGREVDDVLDSGERPVLLTVMHGALIFAGQLALSIRHDLEFDYVHASRYRGQTSGQDLRWLREPRAELKGRTALLVDDILDEGHTLKAIREECMRRGAQRVLVAAMCVKRHQRRVAGIDADFMGVEVPDAYVFGYGMDYHEQGRNLPDIHMLDGDSA